MTDLVKQQATLAFVRQRELLQLLPFSAATLWRRVRTGDFPAPIKFGPRITCWKMSEVASYIQDQGGQE